MPDANGNLNNKEWLEDLAKRTTSTDIDDRRMKYTLDRLNMPEAVCTCGIVYPKGHGESVSIHSMAQILLDVCKSILEKE
jgi:hypothetical protein